MEFLLASTAESGQILEIAQTLQEKAMKSGMFAFPPVIDVKIDQPQSEFVIDRDKVAAMGLNLEQIGGMFIGTLFTLFVIPSIYMLIARDHGRDRTEAAGQADT